MATKPVTVGVDGSQESLRAVEWAALEARRHASPLRIVSAPDEPVIVKPSVWLDRSSVTAAVSVTDATPAGATFVSNSGACTYLTQFATYAPPNQLPANVQPLSQYLDDAKTGNLPSVAFIETGYLSQKDEHPSSGTNAQTGAAYAAGLINACFLTNRKLADINAKGIDETGAMLPKDAVVIEEVTLATGTFENEVVCPPREAFLGDVRFAVGLWVGKTATANTPTTVAPAVGCTRGSPISGKRAGLLAISARMPSNCPRRIFSRPWRSGIRAAASYKYTGIW